MRSVFRTMRRHMRLAMMTAALVHGLLATPAAACPRANEYDSYRLAEVAFIGVAQDGPTDRHGYLMSPATFEVVEYLKGSGPARLKVETGATPAAKRKGPHPASYGISPRANDKWQVFGELRGGVVRTSICVGSRQMRGSLANTGNSIGYAVALVVAMLLLGAAVLRFGDHRFRL